MSDVVGLRISYEAFRKMQSEQSKQRPMKVIAAQLRFVRADFVGQDVSEGMHGEGRVWAIVEDAALIRAMKQRIGGMYRGQPTSYDAELRPLLVIHTVS